MTVVLGKDTEQVRGLGLICSCIFVVYIKVPALSKRVRETVSEILTFGFTMFDKDIPRDMKLIVVEEGKKLFIRMLFPEDAIATIPNVQLFSQKSPLLALAIEERVHPAE